MATDDSIHDGDVVMRVETDDSTDHRRDQDVPLHEGERHHDQRTMESVEQVSAGGEERRKSNIEVSIVFSNKSTCLDYFTASISDKTVHKTCTR